MKTLFTLLALFWLCHVSAQQVLHVALDPHTEDCLFYLKTIELKKGDSSILKQSTQECDLTLKLHLTPGSYTLDISMIDYRPVSIAFDVAENDSLIDLKTIELEKIAVNNLDEFTVTGIKKSLIKVEADKTTVNVRDNALLAAASVYDAILKIPGVVPYPGGGFAVSGKLASVYFDNIPSTLSTNDLTSLLKSMPATSVDNIEIISNPGASYDANLTGAIVNINTYGRVSGWLSGTVSLNYGLNQNNKLSPSFLLSGKTQKFTWQFQLGYSGQQRSLKATSDRKFNSFSPEIVYSSKQYEQTTSNYAYFRPSVTYKISKKASITANYNASASADHVVGFNQSTDNDPSGNFRLTNSYINDNKSLYQEGTLKYHHKLDTLDRMLDITILASGYDMNGNSGNTQKIENVFSYSRIGKEMSNRKTYFKMDFTLPFPKWKFYVNTGVKLQFMEVKNLGKYNLQSDAATALTDNSFPYRLQFRYDETNYAAYIDLKKKLGKKITLGAGLRGEDFTQIRVSAVSPRASNNYPNLFPSGNFLYEINGMMNFIATYSRKISMPYWGQYDPNLSGYYDSYSTSTGNSAIRPNFYNNLEAKFTVLEYAQIAASYSQSPTQNLNQVVATPGSLSVQNTFQTYKNVSQFTLSTGLPVPLAIFTKGLKFMEEEVDVDNLNFLYFYSERIQTKVPGMENVIPNKPLWFVGCYSQFILPWKIKLNVDYYVSNKGNYQIFQFTRRQQALEFVFSREFYKKKLNTSISFQDIFNTNQNTGQAAYPYVVYASYSKMDTRIIWFKVSWSFGKFEKPQQQGDGGLPTGLPGR